MIILTDSKYLLYIEPTGRASKEPLMDRLTRQMTAAFRAAKTCGEFHGFGSYSMGSHQCICGTTSTNEDYYLPDGTMINSLCVHYLVRHRAEVPAEQIRRVQNLSCGEAEPDEEELAGRRQRLLQPVDWLGRESIESWDNQGLDLRPAFFAMRSSPSTGSNVALRNFAHMPPEIVPIWMKLARLHFGEIDTWAKRAASRAEWKDVWVPILLDMLSHEQDEVLEWALTSLGSMCGRGRSQFLERSGLPRALHDQVGCALDDLLDYLSERGTAVQTAATSAVSAYWSSVTQDEADEQLKRDIESCQRAPEDPASFPQDPPVKEPAWRAFLKRLQGTLSWKRG